MNATIDEGALHACYSPSSAHRWTVCTASATAIAAMERVVPQEENEAAEIGTAAHDEIERVIGPLDGAFVDPATMAVKEIDADHPAVFGISMFVSFARKLPPGRMWIEQRVRLTTEIWGRLDLGHWHEETATVTIEDYKNGFVGVDVEENDQFRIYAAALILQYKLPAKWIRYVCVQPNDFRPGPVVKQWIEPVANLYAWANRVAAIPHGPLTFKFGEHCRDCPLFGTCEPTRDILAHFATAVATGGDVPFDMWAKFLACKKPIDHFFEAGNKAQLKRALADQVPLGMKLVTATKHRVWKSEADARAAVLAAKGVDALLPPTPAQAEGLGMDVSALADKPQGGPALAMESDKRPVWTPKSAAEMFKGVAAGLVK